MVAADLSLEEICDFLMSQGFSDVVIDSFKDQQLDGCAITVGMASSPGPDWLKDVIPILGTRLKVHQALRTLLTDKQSSDGEVSEDYVKSSPTASTVSVSTVSSIPTPNRKRTASNESVTSPPSTKRKLDCLPNPFLIPKFRSSTEANLNEKVLLDGDRRYIVQTLATVLMTHVQRPSMKDCETVARSLISSHSFLKDDEGDGEHSWKWFIYNRCQNVNRKSKPAVAKEEKRGQLTVHFVPPVDAEDDESYKRNLVLLENESKKAKPRSFVMKDLMRRTFNNRWKEYTSEEMTLSAYLEKFPLLKKSQYAAQEFGLIAGNNCLRENFEAEFSSWSEAIVCYCKETQVKSTALQEETKDFSDDMYTDESRLAMMSLRCLTLLFAPLKKKKLESHGDIPYVLKIVPNHTPPSEAVEAANNQPHIVLFEDEDETLQQFFISVEQSLMLQCCGLPSAIFFCVAAHYIYNLSYHQKTGEVWSFVQEKMLQIPSKTSTRRTASASTHFAGISRVRLSKIN